MAGTLDVLWWSPDGRSVPIDPTGLGVEVAEGVRIDVRIEARGAARLAVALALTGSRRLHEQATEASARFVVIPIGDASFLVAVAEPSDEPVNLAPVPSSPRWSLAGGPLPTSDGWLTGRRPEGAGIEFKILPAPEDMRVCALQVSAMPPDAARFTNSRGPGASGSVRFSVPRVSPQLLALECEWEFHATGRATPSWP